ncbi:MAG: GntR family transcriptional regulator [Candidatus Promineifilaceae bacterium]
MSKKRRFPKPVIKQTLADQVADSLRESILDGEWQAGDALPTEPELSEMFDVSRAVVRDATRMLAAQGLVEVRHGKGVFVTQSQVRAFGDALLLALRRSGASVWDVEHFEQIIYPEVFALVASEATDEEIAALRKSAEEYLMTVRVIHEENWQEESLPWDYQERLQRSYQDLMQGIFAATHNQVLQLLAEPLLKLRNVRSWQDDEATPDESYQVEKAYFNAVMETIASRDPDHARHTLIRLMRLPPEAEEAMRNTPVGEVPEIRLSLADSH